MPRTEELKEVAKESKNQKLKKVFEIVTIKQVRRAIPGLSYNDYTIRSPHDAGVLAMEMIGTEDREVFLVICLSTKNKINAVHRAHVGSLNSSVVHPREIFKSAILNNSSSIIVAHNHPSMDTSASKEDIDVTKRLIEAGKLMGIDVLDHLIVGENTFSSLKEKGYI